MKKVPSCLSDAFRLCAEHAQVKHRMSMARIADAMGQPNEWSLYKWIASGAMPGNLIRPFERACGAQYVTAYLAASTGDHILVKVPTGRRASASDIAALQEACTAAVSAVIAFYKSHSPSAVDTGMALGAINGALAALSHERGHIEKSIQPELDL